jgi:hypothetical protein
MTLSLAHSGAQEIQHMHSLDLSFVTFAQVGRLTACKISRGGCIHAHVTCNHGHVLHAFAGASSSSETCFEEELIVCSKTRRQRDATLLFSSDSLSQVGRASMCWLVQYGTDLRIASNMIPVVLS